MHRQDSVRVNAEPGTSVGGSTVGSNGGLGMGGGGAGGIAVNQFHTPTKIPFVPSSHDIDSLGQIS